MGNGPWKHGWQNMPSRPIRKGGMGVPPGRADKPPAETIPGSFTVRRLLPNLIHEVSKGQARPPRPAREGEVAGRCRVCGNVFLGRQGGHGLGKDGTCTSKTACAKRAAPPAGDECYDCDHRHLGRACMARGCGCKQWVYGPAE